MFTYEHDLACNWSYSLCFCKKKLCKLCKYLDHVYAHMLNLVWQHRLFL